MMPLFLYLVKIKFKKFKIKVKLIPILVNKTVKINQFYKYKRIKMIYRKIAEKKKGKNTICPIIIN
jgi:hypothetical protein